MAHRVRLAVAVCAGLLPAAVAPAQYGWDPGMHRRCLVEGPRTYEIEISDCSGAGRWTLGLHSESDYGPGGQCPALPHVNEASGPVQVRWEPNRDGGWAVGIETDLAGRAHPCGKGYFTWTVLMDQNSSAVYPEPLATRLRARVRFDCELAQAAARAIAGWQGWWNGKAHSIELGLYVEHWGVRWGEDYAIRAPGIDFVFVDGAAFGLAPLPKGEEVEVVVDWGAVLRRCLARGDLEPIPPGAPAATMACYVGYELHNWAETGAGRAGMRIRDFRIEAGGAAPRK